MKSIAEALYFLTLRNAFASYLQVDNKDATVLERGEAEKTLAAINCLQKSRAEYGGAIDDNSATVYDMIYIVGKNFTCAQLMERIAFAEKRLSKKGVIVFDYANPTTTKDYGSAWQAVARLRCKPESFVCVVSDVAHGCAVYRPHQRSLAFASQHIAQYDEVEYLQANRALLLNLVTWDQFQLLIRFF